MLDAYIYNGLRTPFGRHAGKLASVRPDDLVGGVMNAVIAASPFKAEQIEDVILGCVNQAGEDSRNVARNALLAAGLPYSVGGQTVNRLCASGLAAIIESARAVTCKEGELYLAGGVESMSRAPFVMLKSESPYAREFKMADTTIGARFPNPKLVKQYGNDSMPETGDNVAKEFSITRDQHPRETTIDNLTKLKSLFEGGIVTAGNASGINDGAAALFVGSKAVGDKAGAKPMARILGAASAAVQPRIMGVGPAYAIPKALERAGLTLKDMDIIEINEAFASQVLGCLHLLKVDFSDARVNPNGGAIAVGHPLGASGARITISAARQLQRSGGRYAVVSLCIGVGQGLAMVIERL